MRKYNVYNWVVISNWLSGTISVDHVYVSLPTYDLAEEFIKNHIKLHYPITDVRLSVSVELIRIVLPNETLPAAYRFNDESIWDRDNVAELYPEIIQYWSEKGISNIRVMPCGPVDEDCLYLNGKWYSYCRHSYEWMKSEDLCAELKPQPAKQRGKSRRKITI